MSADKNDTTPELNGQFSPEAEAALAKNAKEVDEQAAALRRAVDKSGAGDQAHLDSTPAPNELGKQKDASHGA
ncbi:hypothetical protein [Amorphus orientalis]|uniref:Uncharacterized protein n=1 Tax=Amorphus orientalis TaxID=649198 RepID=A0AAE3VKP4_9HYPH|nr:hypothetical protein [Amorphus orientalis]MDQ0313703.1 hypothetical protein [Amorphus orientalis]